MPLKLYKVVAVPTIFCRACDVNHTKNITKIKSRLKNEILQSLKGCTKSDRF